MAGIHPDELPAWAQAAREYDAEHAKRAGGAQEEDPRVLEHRRTLQAEARFFAERCPVLWAEMAKLAVPQLEEGPLMATAGLSPGERALMLLAQAGVVRWLEDLRTMRIEDEEES